MRYFTLLLLTLVCNVMAFADAPLRRPISPTQPAWFVHIDNWNDADPQKIIDMIPEDIKPYVVFNISMSISHNEETGAFDRVPNAYSTARSWLRTCAENNVWAMVQCASGGFSHFSETDLRFYEELYREYPNFVGWNYAEQFWGFDDKFSCSFDQRLNHFADLMKLARKYGGYTCISFCGNIWSLPLSPLAMMKRNAAFAEQAAAAPQNLIICDKYTMSSMFYEYESMNFGSFVAGYTTNFGIRFDQCGWNGELESEKDNMPAAAGAAPVLNNWLLNGGTVNDGPELIWQQDFKTEGSKTLADGYRMRSFSRFPQFDNVSIDLYRKILDGTVRIPTREEVIDRHKLVLINDVNTGDNELVYGAPLTLYDGLYNMNDAEHHHDQKNWFKKTGRYPTIPVVPALVDGLANSIKTQVLRSEYDKRWSTIAKKQAEFNSLFPEEYTGNAFASRVENRWLIYNPLKTGATATADIPLQYNTCKGVKLTMSQYTTCLMKEETNAIHLYLTNYRTDDPSLKCDTIVLSGATAQPSLTWKDRSNHSASQLLKESWEGGIYTVIIAHNGPLDLDIQCSGSETGKKEPVADRVLVAPEKPALYDGPLTHECEDFDFKNTNGYKMAPYALNFQKNFHALGYHELGTASNAFIRDTFNIRKAGNYDVTIRYSAPYGRPTLRLYVAGKYRQMSLPNTASGEWKEYKIPNMAFTEGKNQLIIRGYNNAYNVFLDQVTVSDPEYKVPTSLNVDRYTLSYATYVNETSTDSVILNARTITGPVSVATTGEYSVSASRDGEFAQQIDIYPDENGNIIDSVVYVRLNAVAATGTYNGSVSFNAEGCLEHVSELSGVVSPHPVTLVYDFTDDKASIFASTPPATGITVAKGSSATAGVVSYNGSNALKVYSANGRNGSGALDLTRFTAQSTDYSVTWKQYNGTDNDYKVGMMLRAGKVVGTSSQGYSQGFREGYLFIVYNHPSSSNSEFRIYKSTASTNLSMMVNQGAGVLPEKGTPMWYRATVKGYPIVTLTFEYSTDGETWVLASQTMDSNNAFSSGRTQVAWGLAAMQHSFYLDDITFEGVTYDPTHVTPTLQSATSAPQSAIYNLKGQRVTSMKAGEIYITNGKKIVK
ncbi:MAG: hypothetical protein MSA28_00730 [Prevotella sp.]|nr:hypothetical protein [Prevotella sp.]